MLRSLFLVLVLACITSGCASSKPKTFLDVRERAALELQAACRAYYFRRQPQLVYPDPQMICSHVYSLALRGEPVGNWKL